MKTIIIISILQAVLLPLCAMVFLYRDILNNKSTRKKEETTAVENNEIFNHLFIPEKNDRNKKLKIIKS